MRNRFIFISDVNRDLFSQRGYFILRDIDFQVIEVINDLSKGCTLPINQKFLYASNHQNNKEFNLNIERSLKNVLLPLLNTCFFDYRYLTGHFIIKPFSNESEFQLHQDWSITDESKYQVAHLWIPLQDTGPDNGGMFVVEGSHKFFHNYRSGSLDIPRIERDELIDQIITPVVLKKGEALVYHPALFHGSYANRQKADRLAVLVNIIHKDAPLLYYHKNKEETLEVYSLSKRALLSDLKLMASRGIPSDSILLAQDLTVRIDNSKLSSSDLHKAYRKLNPTFFQKILRKFFG